jgi:pimeloyl-ACP methyl ester carboxylesterase
MKLHFRKLGSGQPLVILHGLFGSSDNWQSLAKEWAESFEVYLVDLRNHGHSPHSEEMNYEVMAEDVAELFEEENIQDAILLGHSMGGKTAMQFANTHEDLLDKLVIVDIAPKEYPVHHDQILKALTTADLGRLKSRKAVDEHIAQYIDELTIRQFLMKNLYWKEKGKLGWRINVPVLNREIKAMSAEIEMDTLETPTLFIAGGNSNYISEGDHKLLEGIFLNVTIVSFEKVGHWVHAAAPKKFNEELMKFARFAG